jgi:hypothetical protein
MWFGWLLVVAFDDTGMSGGRAELEISQCALGD